MFKWFKKEICLFDLTNFLVILFDFNKWFLYNIIYKWVQQRCVEIAAIKTNFQQNI